MSKKVFFISVSLVLVLSIAWVLFTPIIFPINEVDAGAEAVHKGFQAPGFTLETQTGELVSLTDYEGQPVLVFFWASWCSVCKRTMPGLESVYDDFAPKGFEILAVNTTSQDSMSSAVDYFGSQGYSYTMLLDRSGDIAETYQLHAVPLSVLVNPGGDVHDVVIGSGMSEGYLRAYLNDVFAGND